MSEQNCYVHCHCYSIQHGLFAVAACRLYVKCQCYECTALRPNVSLETTILTMALCDFIEKVEGLFPFTRCGEHGLVLCALRFCFRLGAWNWRCFSPVVLIVKKSPVPRSPQGTPAPSSPPRKTRPEKGNTVLGLLSGTTPASRECFPTNQIRFNMRYVFLRVAT